MVQLGDTASGCLGPEWSRKGTKYGLYPRAARRSHPHPAIRGQWANPAFEQANEGAVASLQIPRNRLPSPRNRLQLNGAQYDFTAVVEFHRHGTAGKMVDAADLCLRSGQLCEMAPLHQSCSPITNVHDRNQTSRQIPRGPAWSLKRHSEARPVEPPFH